ncbi:MAG: FAD-dependent oxidoreductase, partial [Nitrososphaerota archaeon]|nr:FAD-dependent oxidoreductase [Nitrososphaerota archaeon]
YIDPEKRALFGRTAERSHEMWSRLASQRGVPWKEIGTLMVATEEAQVATLERYMEWAPKNGLAEGECELLDGPKVQEIESSVSCRGAILSNRDASTDFAALTKEAWAMAAENGAKCLCGAEVGGIEQREGGFEITIKGGRSLSCSLLVNTAGGRSLDIAHRMGLAEGYTDLHFRGEYWEVGAGAPQVRRSVYSVARHEKFPFLDPHFVVRADGRREVGPNATLVSGPEVYEGVGSATGVASKIFERPLGPKARLFTNGEFLSLVWGEWRSSVSKRAMCQRVRRFMPSLDPDMLVRHGLAGVRSSLIGSEGFVPEALIERGTNSLHVLNYNSPGATGAPAFSAYLVGELKREGDLDGYRPKGRKHQIWDADT